MKDVNGMLRMNKQDIESRWKEYFPELLNGDDDKEVNVHKDGFGWVH